MTELKTQVGHSPNASVVSFEALNPLSDFIW